MLQGVAGGVFPLAFGIVRDTFPREQVAGGLGIISAIFGIGGGIGLPLSGVIVDNFDLEWLFWISLIALPGGVRRAPADPASPPVEDTRVDWLGAALLSRRAGRDPARRLAGERLGLGLARQRRRDRRRPRRCSASSSRVEGRVVEPLIDLAVLRQRAVAATNLTGFLVGVAMFSSFLIIPQFAQAPESAGYGFGFSVTRPGCC